MLKKLATQNRKYLFFLEQEKKLKDEMEYIINNLKQDIKNSDFFFPDTPIIIDEVLRDITSHLIFLYKEENNTPYIEVRFFDFTLGIFQIGKPAQAYTGKISIESFTSTSNILYHTATQIVENILDNLFILFNIRRTRNM